MRLCVVPRDPASTHLSLFKGPNTRCIDHATLTLLCALSLSGKAVLSGFVNGAVLPLWVWHCLFMGTLLFSL